MKNFKTIEYIETDKLAVLKLNRPDKRNALNTEMIGELNSLFLDLKENKNVVMLQIVGKGEVFCAGADISWLKELSGKSKEDIEHAFKDLAEMLKNLYELPQIIFTMVHGSAFGGALGILACSDFVVSSPQTVFSFSEINLGLIPATISPFIHLKIGITNTKKLFFSGEKFDEKRAIEIGLVDQVPDSGPGDLNYETLMEQILKKPHNALKAMKKLIHGLQDSSITVKSQEKSSALIAELILSEQTQQLFQSFLNRK